MAQPITETEPVWVWNTLGQGVFGTRQTGELQFQIADLSRDEAMLPDVQETADLLLTEYPETIQPLINRWIRQAAAFIQA